MNNKQIKNIGTLTDENDAVNMKFIEETKHKMENDLEMNDKKITNVAKYLNNKDVMNLETFTVHYHTLIKKFIAFDHSGNLNMQDNNIYNVRTPTEINDAVNKD